MTTDIYSIPCARIDGHETTLAEWQGQVILVVNTASKCGFTPQYEGLEALYKDYKDRGFVVLGFPCNQFGKQEPGDAAEIQSFCDLNFKTTFPLFAKIEVNGADAHPLYQQLKARAPGLLGSQSVKWNFTKFLINRDGSEIKRFAPKDKPESLASAIEAWL